MSNIPVSRLAYYIDLATNGAASDVDLIMKELNSDVTLAESKFIDYALSLVNSPEGVERISEYLFNGSQIQRNYSTLFYCRRCERGDWDLVKKAFKMGLIDARQAFSK